MGRRGIYFYNNAFYYVVNKANKEPDEFYLHVFPSNKQDLPEADIGAGFETRDFHMEDKEIPLPFWSRYRMAKVYAPTAYAIQSVITGQLPNGQDWWRAKIDFQTIFGKIASISLANFTDANWTNGINNTGAVLLLSNTPKNMWAVKNAKQLKAGETVINVLNVTSDDAWIHVICPAKDDLSIFAYPNTIEVIKE